MRASPSEERGREQLSGSYTLFLRKVFSQVFTHAVNTYHIRRGFQNKESLLALSWSTSWRKRSSSSQKDDKYNITGEKTIPYVSFMHLCEKRVRGGHRTSTHKNNWCSHSNFHSHFDSFQTFNLKARISTSGSVFQWKSATTCIFLCKPLFNLFSLKHDEHFGLYVCMSSRICFLPELQCNTTTNMWTSSHSSGPT